MERKQIFDLCHSFGWKRGEGVGIHGGERGRSRGGRKRSSIDLGTRDHYLSCGSGRGDTRAKFPSLSSMSRFVFCAIWLRFSASGFYFLYSVRR